MVFIYRLIFFSHFQPRYDPYSLGNVHVIVQQKKARQHQHYNAYQQPRPHFESLTHLYGPAGFPNYAAYGSQPTYPTVTTPAYRPTPTPMPVYDTTAQHYPPLSQPPRNLYNQQAIDNSLVYAYPVRNSPCSQNLLIGCGPRVQEVPCTSSIASYPGYGQMQYASPPQYNYNHYAPIYADPYSLGAAPPAADTNGTAATAAATEQTSASPATTGSTFVETNTVNNSGTSTTTTPSPSVNVNHPFDINSINKAVASSTPGQNTNPMNTNGQNDMKFSDIPSQVGVRNETTASNLSTPLPVQPSHLYKFNPPAAASHSLVDPTKVPTMPGLPIQPAHLYNFDSTTPALSHLDATNSPATDNNPDSKPTDSHPMDEPQVGAPLHYPKYKENPLSKHTDQYQHKSDVITTPVHLLPRMASQHHYSAYTPQHYSPNSATVADHNKGYGSHSHPNAWIWDFYSKFGHYFS